jgi:hypothetical protein
MKGRRSVAKTCFKLIQAGTAKFIITAGTETNAANYEKSGNEKGWFL